MIGRITRWFHSSGPPLWAVVCFLVVYLTIEALVWFVWRIGQALGDPDMVPDFYKMRMTAATAAAVLYGAYRLLGFHPVMRSEYRRWLEQTPWTLGKLLPLGSPCLGVADLLLIVALCWLGGRDYPIGCFAPACGFLAAYYLATCLAAATCGQRMTLYLLAFGLVFVLRLGDFVPVALLALAALYPVARAGVRRSLDPAVWPAASLLSRYRELPGTSKDRARQLGWPHAVLGPNPTRRMIKWPETALVPLLAGGLVYAILSHCSYRAPDEDALPTVIFVVTAFMCLIRVLVYVGSYRSPINLTGRLLTGRWIIPGYDKVFLGPLATLAVFFAVEAVVMLLRIPAVIAQPVVITACLATWMNIGPKLRDWQLTGQHRIVPSSIQANRTEFRQV